MSPWEGGARLVAPPGANGVTAVLVDEDTCTPPPVGTPAWSLPPMEQWH